MACFSGGVLFSVSRRHKSFLSLPSCICCLLGCRHFHGWSQLPPKRKKDLLNFLQSNSSADFRLRFLPLPFALKHRSERKEGTNKFFIPALCVRDTKKRSIPPFFLSRRRLLFSLFLAFPLPPQKAPTEFLLGCSCSQCKTTCAICRIREREMTERCKNGAIHLGGFGRSWEEELLFLLGVDGRGGK